MKEQAEDSLRVESITSNSIRPKENEPMPQKKMNLETPLMSEMCFFCGLGPKSYCAVTKVLTDIAF